MPETNLFWDPLSDNILHERDETGVVTAEYTTEPGLYGNLIGQNRQGVERQYHFDAVGSTLALTNDDQQVTDTNAYSAFGEVTEQTGSTVNPFQYVGQMGYYTDDATHKSEARRRTYDNATSRWLSTDPAVFAHDLCPDDACSLEVRLNVVALVGELSPGDTATRQLLMLRDASIWPIARAIANKYSYALNRPVTLVDPSGALTQLPIVPPKNTGKDCSDFPEGQESRTANNPRTVYTSTVTYTETCVLPPILTCPSPTDWPYRGPTLFGRRECERTLTIEAAKGHTTIDLCLGAGKRRTWHIIEVSGTLTLKADKLKCGLCERDEEGEVAIA